MLLKDSERYRLTVQQQQQMIQPNAQQPVLSHSALLASGGPAGESGEKANASNSGLSIRATPIALRWWYLTSFQERRHYQSI